MKPLHHKTHPLAKRGLSLLCILALCLSLLPVTALAADEHGSHSNGWTELTADTTTLSGGSYYLSGDVEYSGTESITVSGEVILCLNDHKLDLKGQHISVGSGASLTLCDCSTGGVLTGGSGSNDGGVYVGGGGTFTMTGGSIAGNTANAGGGVYVDEGGTFTMEDGSINNNQATSGGGGGVMVNKGSFTLSGGSITGNTTNSDTFGYGGGVCLYGTFYLSGDFIIQNNTKAGATDNLYLGWNTIKITGPLGGNARIGVTAEGVPRSFISGWSDNMAGENPADYFSSDSDALGIGLNTAGDAVLGSQCTTITLNPNGGTLPEYSLVEGAALPIPSKTGYTFAGWYENPEFSGNPVTDIPTNSTGELIFYAKWTVNTYTISADVTPEGAGTVTVNSGTSATAEAGTEVTLSATANSGYRFTGWTSSNGVNFANASNASTTFTMPAGDVTVTAGFDKMVTSVSLNKNTLELYTGNSETLTATVQPEDATSQSVTWESNNIAVATVDANGKVTAEGEGEATITVKTADGNYTATCTVKVTDPVYDMTTDTTALDFGSAYTGYAQPAAQTVTVKNTGNQQVTVTLPAANDFIITAGTGFTDGSAAIKPGDTATFTVQPKTGLSAGTYNETIEVTGTEGAAVTIPASFTVKSRPSYNPPTVSEETTDAIADAQPGDTVTVDLSRGSTKLDKEVFEELSGRDVTLVIELGDGLSWTINGSDIPENADFTDIDLGVTMNSDGIPVDIINAITGEHGSVQLELAHDGAFGFTMTLAAPLGEENAGYWANLYYFNESTNKMTFETAAKINSDGTASLSFSHASQYAIVIDDHNHGVVELPFTDVADSDWFYDPVCFVYENGLMTGTSATTFEPNTSLSRAMLVAVLHRLEGSPAASAGDFTDVADGDWYAQAVNWAASVGVVNGFDDGTFQPNTAITREQLAAILRNYAEYKGLDVSASGSLSTFTDAASVSDWAKESVEWAVGSGLLGGYEDSTLRPQGTTTRAEVASVLQRALGNVAGNQ